MNLNVNKNVVITILLSALVFGQLIGNILVIQTMNQLTPQTMHNQHSNLLLARIMELEKNHPKFTAQELDEKIDK